MSLTVENISFILGVLGIGGAVFTIYNAYRNPQIDVDKTIIKLREDIDSLHTTVSEIKEKHLTSVENDIKKLTETIQQLSMTVVKLSTIIDERIPKTRSKKQ